MPDLNGRDQSRQPRERIAVRQNGRVLFIMLDEIDWIEAADNYVCIHCGPDTHVLRETMSAVEARLGPAHFVRIHRSAIVNIDRIKELQPWFRGDFPRDPARRYQTDIDKKPIARTWTRICCWARSRADFET